MVDEEASSDFRTGMDLNPSEPAAEVRDEPSRGIPSPLIEGMSEAVKPDRMETRIAEKNLHIVFGRRISLFNRLNIFSEMLPERCHFSSHFLEIGKKRSVRNYRNPNNTRNPIPESIKLFRRILLTTKQMYSTIQARRE
jgi:hypothetical protein